MFATIAVTAKFAVLHFLHRQDYIISNLFTDNITGVIEDSNFAIIIRVLFSNLFILIVTLS